MAPLHLKRLGLGDLSTKEFQLEELEDKEECETELWLNDDGSVTLGATNGPQYSNYQGTWDITNDDDDLPFRMRLTRSYEVPVGDISYDVIREFWGSLEMVGASVSVSGKIHGSTNAAGNAYTDEQSLVESEIGYFTMIDAVASEASVEGVSILFVEDRSFILHISHLFVCLYFKGCFFTSIWIWNDIIFVFIGRYEFTTSWTWHAKLFRLSWGWGISCCFCKCACGGRCCC